MSYPINGTVTNNGINITYTNNGTGGVDSFIATYTASTGQLASARYTINVTPFTVASQTFTYGSLGVQAAITPIYSSGGPAVSITEISGATLSGSTYTATVSGNTFTLNGIDIVYHVVKHGTFTDILGITFANQHGAPSHATYTINSSVV